jgi:hypothetical protein
MNRKTMAVVLLLGCVILHVAKGQKNNNDNLIQKGMHTFRFDTFGDEAWWGTMLQLHREIEASAQPPHCHWVSKSISTLCRSHWCNS